MVAQDLQIEVPGGTLAATAQGDGQPVVLIHGTAPAIWGDVPGLLAGSHQVIAYDRRSFGAARDLAARDLTAHAVDAAAVLRACAPPATVVAWSIGAVIALEVAAMHPELVEAMVLLEPPLHAKRHPRPRMLSAIAGATLLGKVGREAAGGRRFLRWALGHRDGGSDLERMPQEWHDRLASGDARAVVRELAAGTGEHLDADRLHRIDMPVRVLRGDRSQLVFADAAQRAVDCVTGAVLVDVTASGHAIQLDAPGAVVDAVVALRPAALG